MPGVLKIGGGLADDGSEVTVVEVLFGEMNGD
jgi:hypothetical protein